MNELQQLEIVSNNVGGQTYKNINLKSKPAKGIKGLDDGNYVIITKKYADGIEKTGKYGKYYIVQVTYLDEDVSFFLTDKEHEMFADTGGEGDQVKITLKKEIFVNKKTGVESLIPRLYFEVA